MTRVIRLRRGLDINLAGRAEKTIVALKPDGTFALRPDSFEGIKPKVLVKEGDKVKAGQTLLILEAMKMENEIAAPKDGTVVQIATSKGAVVETGTPLIVLA